MICNVCFRQCHLSEGQMGVCHARVCREGKVIPAWYGEVSALALDPVEKKPLRHFHPGSQILSVGSLGCNLHCPFCQNHRIAKPSEGDRFVCRAELISPDELAHTAQRLQDGCS